MIEMLRGQMYMSREAIKTALSYIKAGKDRVVQGTYTIKGRPSILSEIRVNGYTLYAEEPIYQGKQDIQSLEGRTMYMTPTSPTALKGQTSDSIPQRRSRASRTSIYEKDGNVKGILSHDGTPTKLYYLANSDGTPLINGETYGHTLLCTDSGAARTICKNGGTVQQGYAAISNPYIVRRDHPLITAEAIREGEVAGQIRDVIESLKEQGYDGIVMDYKAGDNYAVLPFEKNGVIPAAEFETQWQVQKEEEFAAAYSIEPIDGKYMPVVDVEHDTRDVSVAEQYIKGLVSTEKPFETIINDAQPVYIGKDFPGEYRSSKYTKSMRKALRNVKIQAATDLQDMVLLAKNGSWQENLKEKHKVGAANGWYRYDTEFAVPVRNVKGEITHYTVYDAVLLIRNDADGKSYLYDMIDLNEKKKVNSSVSSTAKQSEIFEPLPSSKNSILNSPQNSNSNFSKEEEFATLYSIDDNLDSELQSVLDGTFQSEKNEVYIGETSSFLVDTIGANSLPVLMPSAKAYSAMVTAEQAKADGRYSEDTNYHGLGKAGLLTALEASENPVAAFVDLPDKDGKNRSNRIVLVTDQTLNGEPIVVIEEMETRGRRSGRQVTANKQITVYPRAQIVSDILAAANEDRLLHLDKIRSQRLDAGRSEEKS
ncbi:MAG: hypothetical protein IJS31_02180, partial [Oscillospiraceae bacterium]|nr:hypothetical protein [Oscillospiraceae bacterium]